MLLLTSAVHTGPSPCLSVCLSVHVSPALLLSSPCSLAKSASPGPLPSRRTRCLPPPRPPAAAPRARSETISSRSACPGGPPQPGTAAPSNKENNNNNKSPLVYPHPPGHDQGQTMLANSRCCTDVSLTFLLQHCPANAGRASGAVPPPPPCPLTTGTTKAPTESRHNNRTLAPETFLSNRVSESEKQAEKNDTYLLSQQLAGGKRPPSTNGLRRSQPLSRKDGDGEESRRRRTKISPGYDRAAPTARETRHAKGSPHLRPCVSPTTAPSPCAPACSLRRDRRVESGGRHGWCRVRVE